MEFEQLSIDTQNSVIPQRFTYCTLDNNGKIYCKIDWMTVIFEKCTLNHVLKWLKLENCVSEFCEESYEQSRGYDVLFKFIYNGIVIETSKFGFFSSEEETPVFETVVPKIRLELSGTALDYLRSINVDMDTYRFVVPELPEGGGYHFTRVDWAYDFVNYMPGFVDKMIEHCNVHALPSGRIPLASTRGAIGCRIVTGGQKTVYLGSPQSDSMLRVYDKRMQHIDLNTGVYKKTNPYGNPDSWYRIEWQTRNKNAHKYAIGTDDKGNYADFKSILYDIFEKYAFADGTVKRDRNPVEFWQSLFNWKEIESRIVQNAKYVECETYYEKLMMRVRRQSLFDFLSVLCETTEMREKRINGYLLSLFGNNDPSKDGERQRLINRVNQLLNDVPELIIYPDRESCPYGGVYRFLSGFMVKL